MRRDGGRAEVDGEAKHRDLPQPRIDRGDAPFVVIDRDGHLPFAPPQHGLQLAQDGQGEGE